VTATGRQPLASRLWSHALDALFPPRCVTCRAFGAFLCERCSEQMARAEHPRCGVCWQLSDDTRCADCRLAQPAFEAARSLYVFRGPARDLVHALKYGDVSALAARMAEEMAGLLQDWRPDATAIVPVPMSGPRQRRRGYNQSELIAREMSRISGVPLERRAIVRRGGGSQVEQPDEDARRRNAAQSFAPGRSRVHGDVILIDDVMTTGATLDACARVLKASGAERVFGLTFARED
jgi:ComF family protein